MRINSLSHIEEIRVSFYDADPLGIVWHGNYLKYFEIARDAFGRKYGLSYLNIKEYGYAAPIVKTQTDHKHPLKYGDIALVNIEYKFTEACKLVFEYKIFNKRDVLTCTGQTIQVFTHIKSGKLVLIHPEFFKNWKSKHGLLND